jgi:tetratricopeptide (TPR) repeat protein
MDFLMHAALCYAMLRQFPAALKLYDRALDITPDDPEAMASKAGIYQAQGDLQGAAKFISEKIGPSSANISVKVLQFRLERNYAEAVRLLQARLAQFHYDSQFDKGYDQVVLAFAQRLAGDTAGAKITAEQARNTLEQLYRDQPDNVYIATRLSQAYAAMGEEGLGPKGSGARSHASTDC